MATNRISIGALGKMDITLDVRSLIYSRAIVQANSGGGKSGFLRVLAEQVAHRVPTIIIDKEGEYQTLREKLDLVLVGEQGELAADVRSAGLLARKLIELRASAVIDLSGFTDADPQQEFVKHFLDSLIHLPRKLWHPTLIIIDEAHIFAPEKGMGESVALGAVINLMTLGRKRGFGGVLATTRLAKLHKNAADANNIFIGRTVLDVDQARAGKALGLKSQDVFALREIPTQYFYAFGPDLNFRGVQQFRVNDCETTIPKPGQRRTLKPPKASDVVMKIADKLKDVQQQAEQEIREMAAAQVLIRDLQSQVKQLEKAQPKQVVDDAETKRLRALAERLQGQLEKLQSQPPRKVFAFRDGQLSRAEKLLTSIGKILTLHAGAGNKLSAASKQIHDGLAKVAGSRTEQASVTPIGVTPKPVSPTPKPTQTIARVSSENNGNALLNSTDRKILAVLAQYPEGCERGKLTLLTGLKWNGNFRNCLARLRTSKFIDGGNQETMKVTDGGNAYLQSEGIESELPPPGVGLRNYWLTNSRLLSSDKKILQVLFEVHPAGLNKDEVCEAVDLQWNGNTRNCLSRLRTAGLIVGKNTATMYANKELF